MDSVTKPSILVVDDDLGDSKALQTDLIAKIDPSGRYSFAFCSGQVDGCNSLPLVIAAVESAWPPSRPEIGQNWALVLLDVQFVQEPAAHADSRWGFEVLAALRPRWPDLPIVMLTSEDQAKKTQANWAHANGFLPKPSTGDAGADRAFLTRLNSFGLFPDLRAEARLAGSSLIFLKALREGRRFACEPLGSGRILYGETGTGKTDLARFIHDEMGQLAGRTGAFQTWSALGTDETMAKDALFGHWKGAHSRAESPEPGEIEKAEGGTFLLDEIASLPVSTQGLFIESRRRNSDFRRLISRSGLFPTRENAIREAKASLVRGASLQPDKRIAIDVVMLTASNVNLHDERVANALGFRRDLLNDLGSPIFLPGLNDRRQDIPEIFGQIVRQLAEQIGCPAKHIDETVLSDLMGRDWRDKNIVALRQIAEDAVVAARDFDEILVRHLPAQDGLPGSAGLLSDRHAVPPSQSDVSKAPPQNPAQSISELAGLLANFAIPEDVGKLEGALPALQEAYARLVVKLFGSALRATRKRDGKTSSLDAVCKLLGVRNLKGKPQSYAAYDVVLRILGLCDTKFIGLAGGDSALYQEIRDEDEDVRKHVEQAITQRRKPARKSAP